MPYPYHTNPTYRKILEYLNGQEYSVATFRVAKFCLNNSLPGVMPGKNEVNRAYGYLKRMSDKGLVLKTGRGLWKIHRPK